MDQSAWGDDATKFFFELTPDRILSAVESFGVRSSGRVVQLNSLENRVFEIELLEEENNRPVSVIAKFYRPGRWSREQILEEHQFLFDLIDYDIPVVAPRRAQDGSSLHHLNELGIELALFSKARGRSPQEFTNEDILRMGRLVARVHNVGATQRFSHRLALDVETYGWNNLDAVLDGTILPDELYAQYEDTASDFLEAVTPLFDGVKYQRVHGDLHLGNILWGAEGPFLVDFDDVVNGPAVQDLWLLLPGREAADRAQFELLLSGYEEMREFDRSQLALIEPLRGLRFLHFSAWIGKRWADPIFPKFFPQYDTARYWQEQIQDLREILEFLD